LRIMFPLGKESHVALELHLIGDKLVTQENAKFVLQAELVVHLDLAGSELANERCYQFSERTVAFAGL
jgi:hypothetical protein